MNFFEFQFIVLFLTFQFKLEFYNLFATSGQIQNLIGL